MLSTIKYKEVKTFVKSEVYPYQPSTDELWTGIKTSVAYINSFYNSLQAAVYKTANKVTFFQNTGGTTTVIKNNYIKHIRSFGYDPPAMILETCEFASSNDSNVTLVNIQVTTADVVNTKEPSLNNGYSSLVGVNLFNSFKVNAGLELPLDTLNIQVMMTYYRFAEIPTGLGEVPDENYVDVPPTDLLWLVLLSAQRIQPRADLALNIKIKEIEQERYAYATSK